ncbi:MAG: DoxX family protein [Bacteroidota bacterium]
MLFFLSEGIQKFLYPAILAPGRFEGMGLPNPGFWGNFVWVFEIFCGILLLAGLITRVAALAMLVNMTVALS